jgi:hypothetical protein
MKINPKTIAIVLAVFCVIILAVFFLSKNGVIKSGPLSYTGKFTFVPGPVVPPAQPPYKPTDQEVVFAKYW